MEDEIELGEHTPEPEIVREAATDPMWDAHHLQHEAEKVRVDGLFSEVYRRIDAVDGRLNALGEDVKTILENTTKETEHSAEDVIDVPLAALEPEIAEEPKKKKRRYRR